MAKFKAVLRPDGVIRKMDGHEEFVKLLTFGSSHESQLKSMMSGDGPMKTMIAPLSEFLPAQPDRVGAHWLRHDDVDYGSIGRYLRKSKYVYHGNAGTVHEIRATTTMNYKAADKKDPGLPFEIADFKIAKAEGKGTFHFDADLGRLKESVQELHLIANTANPRRQPGHERGYRSNADAEGTDAEEKSISEVIVVFGEPRKRPGCGTRNSVAQPGRLRGSARLDVNSGRSNRSSSETDPGVGRRCCCRGR